VKIIKKILFKILNKYKRRRLEFFFTQMYIQKWYASDFAEANWYARRQHDISYTLWPILQLHGLRTVIDVI